MMQRTLRATLGAIALAAASFSAQAAYTVTLDFDTVASGTSANAYLDSLGLSGMRFVDGAIADDAPIYDDIGNLLNDGAFHWVAGTHTVLAKNDGTAVSGSNVLWDDHAPILLQFATPIDIEAFSVQQDNSNYGWFFATLSFLDSTGHVIAGKNVDYTQFGQPGYTISSGPVSGVSAILLPALKSYDNLTLSTTTPVPEPSTWWLGLGSLAVLGALTRRHKAAQ